MWHFVALTPSWHSSQPRRALNMCVLQNTSYKTGIIINYCPKKTKNLLQVNLDNLFLLTPCMTVFYSVPEQDSFSIFFFHNR
jgi:hypothetical protein